MKNLISNLRHALAGAAITATFIPISASGAPFTLALQRVLTVPPLHRRWD